MSGIPRDRAMEGAVLHAINSGGQNQSRAMLTGALRWALSAFPGDC